MDRSKQKPQPIVYYIQQYTVNSIWKFSADIIKINEILYQSNGFIESAN